MTNDQPQQATTGAASGGYVKHIANDAREGEMEKNLTQVGSILGNLGNTALDMGNVIEAQNRQIDRIAEEADISSDRVEIADVGVRHSLTSKVLLYFFSIYLLASLFPQSQRLFRV